MFKKGKKDVLFVKLLDIAEILRETSQYFHDFKLDSQDKVEVFYSNIKGLEEKGDKAGHILLEELNKSFITPIEREDILHLAIQLDDVIDVIDDCAAHFAMYDIYKTDAHMVEFSVKINDSAKEIYKAVELLADKKFDDMITNLKNIKANEHTCDVLYRQGIRDLFKKLNNDPVNLIKYNKIYDLLEDIADECKKVANIMETIIMKNA